MTDVQGRMVTFEECTRWRIQEDTNSTALDLKRGTCCSTHLLVNSKLKHQILDLYDHISRDLVARFKTNIHYPSKQLSQLWVIVSQR